MMRWRESAGREAHRKRHSLQSRVLLTTRKAVALSLLVTVTSLLASLQTGDWSWFSRSGSLVVIIGIMLTSSQIIENSRSLRARRARHAKNFDRDFAEDMKQKALARYRGFDDDIWENGLRGFYLLVAGTLIWGYGDLPGRFF